MLAVEHGLSPIDLEQCSGEMLDAIVGYLDRREKERKKQEQKQARAKSKTRGR